MSELTLVDQYLLLGLRMGKHIDGFVDAYYGPAEHSHRVDNEPLRDPHGLAADARALLADVMADTREMDAQRQRWLAAQLKGVETSARKLGGDDIAYIDEVEACYGVRPEIVPEEAFEEAHQRLESVLPGSGPLRERLINWREAQVVPSDVLPRALMSIKDELQQQTVAAYGLPEEEHIEFELVKNEPWSGFNYYLGGFQSKVAINTDLPMLAGSLGHLVAHEAYPGHHTEHSLKEARLVRSRKQLEESIFLVGTPHCLVSEGLADLGLEIMWPENRGARLAAHLHPLGVKYEPEVAEQVSKAATTLAFVGTNMALKLHGEGVSVEDSIAYEERWGLTTHNRAAKRIEFVMHPVWRAYTFCYTEGLRLCRAYANGDPLRFRDLLTEQLTTADLVDAAAA